MNHKTFHLQVLQEQQRFYFQALGMQLDKSPIASSYSSPNIGLLSFFGVEFTYNLCSVKFLQALHLKDDPRRLLGLALELFQYLHEVTRVAHQSGEKVYRIHTAIINQY